MKTEDHDLDVLRIRGGNVESNKSVETECGVDECALTKIKAHEKLFIRNLFHYSVFKASWRLSTALNRVHLFPPTTSVRSVFYLLLVISKPAPNVSWRLNRLPASLLVEEGVDTQQEEKNLSKGGWNL